MPLDRASLYAALHRGEPGDLAHYLRATAGRARILELGAGFGRLVAPLLEAGHDVVALELDPQMLGQGLAAVPTARWIEGDMTGWATDERFDAIVAAHNTLRCVPLDAVAATFTLAARHLAPGGMLLFDVYDAEGIEEGDDALEHVVTVEVDDVIYDVFEQDVVARGCLEARYVFRGRNRTQHELTITHHLHSIDEIRAALVAAGLRVHQEAGGFADEPWDAEAERWVVAALRTAPP